MNARIRAKRILKNVKFYKENPSPIPHPIVKDFGLLIGRYFNPKPSNDVLLIFDDGIVWGDSGKAKSFRYADVNSASVPESKTSLEIVITTRNGEKLHMPVAGTDGKFFDSMEMLRFVNRVVEDLSASPKKS